MSGIGSTWHWLILLLIVGLVFGTKRLRNVGNDLGAAINEMARRLGAFQDELQRTERLQVLGQFSGGLAHQLRNAAAGAKLAVELFLAENGELPMRRVVRGVSRVFRGEKPTGDLSETAGDYWKFRAREAGLTES